jgi:eukaryotic-like serine/threonine-protein kinase
MSGSFGPYQIMRKIGEGGFSVVYEAVDHQLRRPVALKLLNADILWNGPKKQRFLREIEVCRRLRHPHIVKVYRAGFINDRGYVSMKLMRGGSLTDLIDHCRRPLDPARTVIILSHVASAIDAAHRAGIIHRDVKSANVLLDERGNAYLADFGMTKLHDMASVTRDEIMGTVHYMAPEQVKGLRYMTQASDVYSLGVILYEMATGRLPFNGLSQAVLHHIVHSEPVRPRAVTPAAGPHQEQALLRALAKDPRQRFRSAGALVAAYQEALRQDRVVVPVNAAGRGPSPPLRSPTPRPPQARPAPQQNQFWVIMIALVAITLLLMLFSS